MTTHPTAAEEIPLLERLRALQLPPPAQRREIRKAARASLSAVAQELNVDAMTVSRWERGLARPRDRHVVAYRRLLEGLADLVKESAQKPKK